MVCVGITGGIGSGKTLVCRILEILGVPVYNADLKARMLMNTHSGLITGIRELFGNDAYHGGELDRKYLASRVFGDEEMLRSLNRMVHPVVREDFMTWAGKQSGVPYVVEEAAILFESGADRFMDCKVLVYAPREVRISRVMGRDRVSREEVIRRMSHQWDDEDKRSMADEVIRNDGSQMLLPQILRLHEKLCNGK